MSGLIKEIKDKIRGKGLRILLPESEDERVLNATSILLNEDLAKVTLLGDKDNINKKAKDLGLSIQKATIVSPETFADFEAYLDVFAVPFEKKGISRKQCRKKLLSPMFFGGMMLKQKDVDGLVAGCVTSTADVLRGLLRTVGIAEGIKTVSSFFIMVLPENKFGENGILFYADGAVVPDPTSEQLADIAVSTSRIFQKIMDKEPRTALLSFSTKGSANHPLVRKVADALEYARQKDPSLKIDGELQADSAIVLKVARRKVKTDSDVAGKANVLIFPDLNSGNICYKLTQRLANAAAFGPVLQGLARPASDLSRGCNAYDIVDISCIVALEALMSQ
ncbi:MAG: phosphate acetyltransferase [Candidatus Theseobacter exili]|nr:phosphate acetyltransferase [Candidatus Theseobacter exili]